MKQIAISGVSRTDLGKKATKEVRKNGNVPCVIYGEKKGENGLPEAIHFYTPHIYLVNVTIDGTEHQAVLKEVQFHPVKDNVLHVDFYEVRADKPIVVGVPIAPQGLAEGVRAGGRLMAMVRKLNVKATYENIPEKLNIDVTKLQLGKSIKAGAMGAAAAAAKNA